MTGAVVRFKSTEQDKTDKTKEIILWLGHLTSDLRHIDNKSQQENISKMFITMTPATI